MLKDALSLPAVENMGTNRAWSTPLGRFRLTVGLRFIVAVATLLPAMTLEAKQVTAAAEVDLVVIDTSGEVPKFRTVSAPGARAAAQLERVLERDANIEVEQRVIYELADVPANSDPLGPKQWAHDVMQVQAAWQEGSKGAGVTVAVVDTGISPHTDLAGRVIAARDFVRVGGVRSHGTNVAGIIAANAGNAVGVAGIAPEVSLLDARACADVALGCPSEALAEAIVWSVQRGADVVNMSLGSTVYDAAMAAAVQYAQAHGVVVVAASGNEACKAEITGNNGEKGPNGNCVSSARFVSYPAALPGVISVAAIEQGDKRAVYSSYAPSVAIGAPTKVLTTNHVQYGSFNGTSAAAPHVAGVAALMLAANPSLSAESVRTLLMATARPYATPLQQPTWAQCGEIDPALGYWRGCSGLSNDAISQRELGGTGIVQALAAVRAAKQAPRDAAQVTSASDALLVSVNAVAGAVIYEVLLDNTVHTRTSAVGTVRIENGLIRGAQHIVRTRAFNAAGTLLFESAPVLAGLSAEGIVAPQVRSATYGARSKSTIQLETVLGSGVEGVTVYDAVGTPIAGCQGWPDDSSVGCSFRPEAGMWYTARFANQRGELGAPSSPFQFRLTDLITLPTPEVEIINDVPGEYTVAITPMAGAARYVFVAGRGTAQVSSSGQVLANNGNATSCELLERLMCRVTAEIGAIYTVQVAASSYAAVGATTTSFYTASQYVVSEPPVARVAGLYKESETLTSMRLRWSSDARAGAQEPLQFSVFMDVGVVVQAGEDERGWFADVPVGTSRQLEVTVLGERQVKPQLGEWWYSVGEPYTATFSVTAVPTPAGAVCTHSTRAAWCSIPRTGALAQTMFEGELVDTDGMVLGTTTLAPAATGDMTFIRPLSLVGNYAVRLRSVTMSTPSRASSWVEVPVAKEAATEPAKPTTTPVPHADPPAASPPLVSPPIKSPVKVAAALRGSKLVLSWGQPPGSRISRIEVLRNGKVIARLAGTARKYTLANKTGRNRYVIMNISASNQRAASAPVTVRSAR